MRSFTVKASTEYDVIMGSGLLSDAGRLIRRALPDAEALVVITDDTVAALYGKEDQPLMRGLKEAGFRVSEYVFPHGERSKTLNTVEGMLEYMASDAGLTRKDAAVALGGGVCGDMAGLAAALYMRGIRFVQLPTSLLAAVDSSVGGKTAVDLSAGKNLAGAFWQPSLVLYDTDTAMTLERTQLMEGLAEAVKSGIIADPSLFSYIRDRADDLKGYLSGTKEKDPSFTEMSETIAFMFASVKRDIVQRDEKESGERKLLNLGHTLGHAAEKLSGFELSHGLAVAKGTALITKAACSAGLCEKETADAIISLLTALGFDLSCPWSAEELAEAALSDKKRRGSNITLVIPAEIGKCFLEEVHISQLTDFIENGL